MPKRIQRKRTKGWRMPEDAVYVGRPTKWGNPFTFAAAEDAGYTRRGAVSAFADWLSGNPWACGSDTYAEQRSTILINLTEIRGKDLVCWCRLDQACHADVLLDLANR